MEEKRVVVLSPSRRGWRVSFLRIKMNGDCVESSFKGIRTVKSREQATLFAKVVCGFEDTKLYQTLDSDRDVGILSRELHKTYLKQRGLTG